MVRTMKQPRSKDITSLLNAVSTQGVQSVTQALREFKRDYALYPCFKTEDAERIFSACNPG